MGILDDITTNRSGRILLSIIWGLGLATLFRKVCKGRNCIVIKAPNPKDIKENIYGFDGKCYKFSPKVTSCKKKH
tara:strand:+ start:144 stop:368 length:225 start_codon:yes stop_codon:yes gene_type:complete